MAHKIFDREHRRMEKMARKSDLHGLFAHIADINQPLTVPKPLLIGSREGSDIHIQGFAQVRAVLDRFFFLDHVYDPTTRITRTQFTQKRSPEERLSLVGPIQGALHRHYLKTVPHQCFLSGHSKCEGRIIHAHSIQAAQIKPHAKDGKVYFAQPLAEREDSMIPLKLIGANRATTFTGICEKHDREVFLPIEVVPFTGTPEQIFLYHYRDLLKDYFVRLHARAYIRKVASELAPQGLDSQLNHIRDLLEMTKLDVLEIEAGKGALDGKLKEADFNDLSGCWMRGSGTPGVLFTTVVYPWRDLRGRPFPGRHSVKLENWVSLTVTIEDNLPLVMVSGRRGSPVLCQMLDSIRETPLDQLPAALCRYGLACTERFVVVPAWWEGLKPSARRAARLLFNTRFYTDYFKGPFGWSFDSPNFF
jgi:hypothetical protein